MKKQQKVAVIGATGYVGRAVVTELAQRGHEVVAFSRSDRSVDNTQNIHFVEANVLSDDFAQQLQGFDAVVSAFNAGWDNPRLGQDYTQGARAIVESAKRAKVPYLLVVGGAGSLWVADDMQLIDTPDFPSEIFDGANAARQLLGELKVRNDVNWAFISPPAMLGVTGGYSEERTGQYRLGSDRLLMNGDIPAGMSVADLAIAIADDVESRAHLHQHFTVASVS